MEKTMTISIVVLVVVGLLSLPAAVANVDLSWDFEGTEPAGWTSSGATDEGIWPTWQAQGPIFSFPAPNFGGDTGGCIGEGFDGYGSNTYHTMLPTAMTDADSFSLEANMTQYNSGASGDYPSGSGGYSYIGFFSGTSDFTYEGMQDVVAIQGNGYANTNNTKGIAGGNGQYGETPVASGYYKDRYRIYTLSYDAATRILYTSWRYPAAGEHPQTVVLPDDLHFTVDRFGVFERDAGSSVPSSKDYNWVKEVSINVVPEPATILLLSFGSLSLLRRRRA